jgi:hypothetical protein
MYYCESHENPGKSILAEDICFKHQYQFARKVAMKYIFLLMAVLFIVGVNCHDNSTGPNNISNLIPNPTFETNGVPSLKGWKVAVGTTVTFSTDLPEGGAGHSIMISADETIAWPANCIYMAVPVVQGTHAYRLNFFAKKNGTGGGVFVCYNRPGSAKYRQFLAVSVTKSFWARYSVSDTLSIGYNDTLFVYIHGGRVEKSGGTTYFNTCTLEQTK